MPDLYYIARTAVDDEVELIQRDLLRAAREKLTIDQNLMFGLMYPKGVKAHELNHAIALCRATAARNDELL